MEKEVKKLEQGKTMTLFFKFTKVLFSHAWFFSIATFF